MKKCEVCGSPHEPWQAHHFVKDSPVFNTPIVKDKPPVKNVVKDMPRSTKWQRANRDKYNTYMREYMKKRRAK
jgi:hypothetical protein